MDSNCTHEIHYKSNWTIQSINELRQECYCTKCETQYWRLYTPRNNQTYSDIPSSIVPTVELIGPELVEVRYSSVKRLDYTADSLIEKTK